MKILLSPSKTMADAYSKEGTNPLFEKEATLLLNQLKSHSVESLMTLFEVSEKIAKENYERFQHFNPVHKAYDAYTGYMFKMMDKPSLKEKETEYIKTHLMIVSGLYGLVRMTDLIGHYRLPMGVSLKKPLASFWKPYLTNIFKNTWVLDLMSQEYRDAFDMNELDHVTIDFVEIQNGKEKRSAMTLKKCRGMMVRACALKNIQTKEALKKLSIDQFNYQEKGSTPTLYRFERIKKA
jgi:cytoplasmic iron level regulating protein YaaA (DUF328/UPF0246 family)